MSSNLSIPSQHHPRHGSSLCSSGTSGGELDGTLISPGRPIGTLKTAGPLWDTGFGLHDHQSTLVGKGSLCSCSIVL